MKRYWGHVIAGLSIAIGAVVVATACVHDDQTLFIRSVQAAPQTVVNNQCIYTPDPTQPVLSNGIVDDAFTDSYFGWMLLGDQMIPQGNPNAPTTETSRIEVEGVIVRITDILGNQLDNYTRAGAATVDPSSGTTPGWAVLGAEIVSPKAIAAAVGNGGEPVRVITYIKAFGHTLGGTYIESNEFQFPVDICKGCLVIFPAGSSDPTLQALCGGQPNCKAPATGVVTTQCYLGQDQAIDCRQCGGIGICDPSHGACNNISLDAGAG
jgi:hypothetical protein